MSSLLDILKSVGASKDVKAAAISAGIQALTGSQPIVTRKADTTGTYIEITPTEAQAEILRAQLEVWLSKAPSDVRVNLSGIWWPVVIKKTGLWAVGYGALAVWLGRKSV